MRHLKSIIVGMFVSLFFVILSTVSVSAASPITEERLTEIENNGMKFVIDYDETRVDTPWKILEHPDDGYNHVYESFEMLMHSVNQTRTKSSYSGGYYDCILSFVDKWLENSESDPIKFSKGFIFVTTENEDGI